MNIATVPSLCLVLFLSLALSVQVNAQTDTIINPNYKHARPKWSPVEDLVLFDSDIHGKRSIYITDSKGNKYKV